MGERLILLAAMTALALIGVGAWRMWAARRLRQLARHALPPDVAALLADHGPTLLYFTAPHCVQCRMQQTPILHNLATTADISIQTIDAVETPDLARFFGVMTVPTTIFVDAQQRPTAINHGLTSLQRLQEQMAAAA